MFLKQDIGQSAFSLPVSSYGVAHVATNMSVTTNVATEASTGARLLAVFRFQDLKKPP